MEPYLSNSNLPFESIIKEFYKKGEQGFKHLNDDKIKNIIIDKTKNISYKNENSLQKILNKFINEFRSSIDFKNKYHLNTLIYLGTKYKAIDSDSEVGKNIQKLAVKMKEFFSMDGSFKNDKIEESCIDESQLISDIQYLSNLCMLELNPLFDSTNQENLENSLKDLIGRRFCVLGNKHCNKNVELAEKFFENSVSYGYKEAYFYLGKIHLNKKIYKAISCFKMIKNIDNEQGLRSRAYLGMIYYQGIGGINVNLKKAYKYFEASQNYPPVLYNLATMSLYGLGCKKNANKYLELLEKAAQFRPIAKYELALHFFQIGNYKNAEKIFNSFKHDLNKCEAEEMYFLGKCYSEGIGTEKDDKLGFELKMESYKKGYPHAIQGLYLSYYYGWGTKADINEAAKYCEKYAQLYKTPNFNPWFAGVAAFHYAKGIGVEKNTELAEKLIMVYENFSPQYAKTIKIAMKEEITFEESMTKLHLFVLNINEEIEEL